MRLLPYLAALTVLATGATSARAESDVDVSLGVRVQPSGWSIKPEGGRTIEANAMQTGFDVNVRYEKWFFGLGLIGGRFEFSNAELTTPSGDAADSAEIRRGELDLIVGYQAWPQVAVFTGVKNIGQEWVDDDTRVEFTGLGFGMSAFHEFTPLWAGFATFGLVGGANIKVDGDNVGKGGSITLETGALYRYAPHHNLTFGLRVQGQEYRYDSGDNVAHSLGGLALRYYYVF